MTLGNSLVSRNTSMAAFAAMVDTTTATISRVADGSVVPRKDLMRRIHDATDGLVTPNDLTGLHGNERAKIDVEKEETDDE